MGNSLFKELSGNYKIRQNSQVLSINFAVYGSNKHIIIGECFACCPIYKQSIRFVFAELFF